MKVYVLTDKDGKDIKGPIKKIYNSFRDATAARMALEIKFGAGYNEERVKVQERVLESEASTSCKSATEIINDLYGDK